MKDNATQTMIELLRPISPVEKDGIHEMQLDEGMKMWLALDLGISDPWIIESAKINLSAFPYRLDLIAGLPWGTLFPCPICGKLCKAHDFKKLVWRHRDMGTTSCFITARVPRTKCEKDGVHRIKVPWTERGAQPA